MTDADPAAPWAFGRLALEEDRFEDVAIGVSERRGVRGTEEIAVVDVELEAREPGTEVAFTVTVAVERARGLADDLRDAAGVGRRTPDDRPIADVATIEECGRCGWAPAPIILTGGEWECYNCGADAGGRDE